MNNKNITLYLLVLLLSCAMNVSSYASCNHTLTIATSPIAPLVEIDGVFPSLYSPARSKFLDYSLPVIGHVQTALYRHSDIVNAPVLAESSVATLRSFEYEPSELDYAVIYELATFEQVVGLLEKQRVNYIYGVKEIIDFQITQLCASAWACNNG